MISGDFIRNHRMPHKFFFMPQITLYLEKKPDPSDKINNSFSEEIQARLIIALCSILMAWEPTASFIINTLCSIWSIWGFVVIIEKSLFCHLVKKLLNSH